MTLHSGTPSVKSDFSENAINGVVKRFPVIIKGCVTLHSGTPFNKPVFLENTINGVVKKFTI